MKDGINTETTLRIYVQMGCEQKFNNRGGQVHVITKLVVVIGASSESGGSYLVSTLRWLITTSRFLAPNLLMSMLKGSVKHPSTTSNFLCIILLVVNKTRTKHFFKTEYDNALKRYQL